MKTLLASIPLALLLTFLSPAGSAQAPASRPTLPIGYISAQRILAESTIGRAQSARFQTAQQQKTGELRAKQQALEATRQLLAQATDNAARLQLGQQEQQQRTDLERSTAQAQTDLQTIQREVQTELQTQVKSVLADLVKARDLELVLNSDNVLAWGAANLDLTPAVIERLNAAPAPATPKQ
jgi:Skp family chaperone for outer membrane proteins